MKVDGYKLPCTCKITNPIIHLGNRELNDDFYAVNIGDNDVILGIYCMFYLVEFSINLWKLEKRFKSSGEKR